MLNNKNSNIKNIVCCYFFCLFKSIISFRDAKIELSGFFFRRILDILALFLEICICRSENVYLGAEFFLRIFHEFSLFQASRYLPGCGQKKIYGRQMADQWIILYI
jgi:hypothetical protein